MEYKYSPSIPHAVTSVNRGSFTDSFTYDENGNMTCRVESGVIYRQNYNAENRISSMAKINGACNNATAEILEAWSYTYDGDGVRVSTAHFTGMNSTPHSFTRYYFGGAYETSDDGTIKKYYSIAGQTIAMRTWDVDLGTWNLSYFLSDHLGSTSLVLDANGGILEQGRYLPFGGARVMPPFASVTSTDFTYTGQRNLPNTGLMDYKARFYSPTLGRFIQPETIVPNVISSQNWNRYSYVTNNPVGFTDPTGHVTDDGCGGYHCPDNIPPFTMPSDCMASWPWMCDQEPEEPEEKLDETSGTSGTTSDPWCGPVMDWCVGDILSYRQDTDPIDDRIGDTYSCGQ